MKSLATQDPAVARAILSELDRQEYGLEMIASENYVSEAVLEAQGSVLTNKYAEGLPHKRYYGGCDYVDIVEDLARDRAKELFGCDRVNVQPHSGAQANMAVYLAAMQPGDTVLGMDLSNGGHLTHGSKVNFSGTLYHSEFYGVDVETGRIDWDHVRSQAHAHKPKLIVCGASAYPREIEFAKFRAVADEVGALLLADIAHVAGLVAAKLHDDPIPHCDFVTTTTHKTLRGPRGGMTMSTKEWGKKINKAVFPGMQGGPLMHVIAAKAVALGEAAASPLVEADTFLLHGQLARWNLKVGKDERYLEALEEGAERNPLSSPGWYRLALAQLRAGLGERAVKPADRAFAMDPRGVGGPKARLLQAWVALEQDRPEDAGELAGVVKDRCADRADVAVALTEGCIEALRARLLDLLVQHFPAGGRVRGKPRQLHAGERFARPRVKGEEDLARRSGMDRHDLSHAERAHHYMAGLGDGDDGYQRKDHQTEASNPATEELDLRFVPAEVQLRDATRCEDAIGGIKHEPGERDLQQGGAQVNVLPAGVDLQRKGAEREGE